MKRATEHALTDQHELVKEQYDQAQSDGRYEEGMARMAVYHEHCQDPVIFEALGDVHGKSLLDLACGDGFYTRRFRTECGADPVMGIDLSPKAIERAQAIEEREQAGIDYRVGDVVGLELERRFDVVTAIHLLHYLQNAAEIESALRAVHGLLTDDGYFVTMIANPEFELDRHDSSDSKTKFGYYFSLAEPGNGGLMRFHPGGFEKERELTVEFRRWERGFIDEIARKVGFNSTWHEPSISSAGLKKYGAGFFANYLPNPQSKLLRLTPTEAASYFPAQKCRFSGSTETA
ncbi:MAG TPA: class I SAM-dependent methyltransferase [Woeseiaceae bacterium]|nr:class I SAM-dependent methyltransferase [Woeseiaceae bacterium]